MKGGNSMKNKNIINEVILHFKTQSNLARTLGVSKQAVNQWYSGEKNIPLLHAFKLERLTDGKFKAEQFLPIEKQEYLRNIND